MNACEPIVDVFGEQMDRYLRSDDGAWRRVPKSAGDVAREEADEEVAAELVG